jgi:acetylornithine deacetylase/succinyl-diaminopimelate desuccinylase-like protein
MSPSLSPCIEVNRRPARRSRPAENDPAKQAGCHAARCPASKRNSSRKGYAFRRRESADDAQDRANGSRRRLGGTQHTHDQLEARQSLDDVTLQSQRLSNALYRNGASSYLELLDALQAGTKENIIPDDATLKLNVRTDDEDVREYVLGGVPHVFWIVGGTDPPAYAQAKATKRLNELPSNHSPRYAAVLRPTLKTGLQAMLAGAGAWLAAAAEPAT